ncbi:MAG TPA: hypothetical protein GX706_03985 [Candidatus Moranbacteria bacterium]|nr:hypothetical protein [Candidatus Moranbacteria bacterium]
MKSIQLFNIFKSGYCWLALFIMLGVSYFLVPKKIFYGYYNLIAIAFILVFALNMTCLIRIIKDRIVEHKNQKITSFGGFLFGIIGLSALQTCAVGAPVCGASIGMAVMSSIFPAVAFDWLEEYSLAIVLVSILVQIFSLYQMKCFQKVNSCPLN